MSDYSVRVAGEADRDAVLDVLMLAFSSDPCMRFGFDKAERYRRHFNAFATAMGGAAFAAGSAWLADEGGAAALWLPPGVSGDGEAIGAIMAETAPPALLETLGQVGEQMQQYHPHEPHWYLPLIGVDPARQGRGLGSALLKAALERCDEDGLPAYLESSNPKNVPLYERFGFEVLGVIQPGGFGPLIPMLRPAR
jgi:ribosomal protein S18 acetylase RimI-like enzyme